jgi:hypothetical protein
VHGSRHKRPVLAHDDLHPLLHVCLGLAFILRDQGLLDLHGDLPAEFLALDVALLVAPQQCALGHGEHALWRQRLGYLRVDGRVDERAARIVGREVYYFQTRRFHCIRSYLVALSVPMAT